jgi:DnaJ-class molecular chaperone
MTNFYEILEISRHATLEEIRAAYRRLALRYHPDKNPGDQVAEKQFKRVSEAYQVLADTEKRQLYDLYGDAGLAGLDVGGFSGFEEIFNSFGEIFEDFFSYGRSKGAPDQPQPGADLRQRVVLTLEEVAQGLNTSLSVERRVICTRCGGGGAEPGSTVPPARAPPWSKKRRRSRCASRQGWIRALACASGEKGKQGPTERRRGTSTWKFAWPRIPSSPAGTRTSITGPDSLSWRPPWGRKWKSPP